MKLLLLSIPLLGLTACTKAEAQSEAKEIPPHQMECQIFYDGPSYIYTDAIKRCKIGTHYCYYMAGGPDHEKTPSCVR